MKNRQIWIWTVCAWSIATFVVGAEQTKPEVVAKVTTKSGTNYTFVFIQGYPFEIKETHSAQVTVTSGIVVHKEAGTDSRNLGPLLIDMGEFKKTIKLKETDDPDPDRHLLPASRRHPTGPTRLEDRRTARMRSSCVWVTLHLLGAIQHHPDARPEDE